VGDDFYSVYYSQGVLLEAQLIANRLAQARADVSAGARIIQVYRQDDIGAAAAERLRATLAPGWALIDRALAPDSGGEPLRQTVRELALHGLKAGDILVLWLRASDLQALPAPVAAAASAEVYVSGVMGGLEHAPLAPPWRRIVRLTYPFELPEARRLRMGYPLGWFHQQAIPVVNERVEVDTFITCSILAQSLRSMIGEYQRDYLLERVEAMLSSRVVDGYYARLGLAPGQRYASKGGYLVRFVDPADERIVADGSWIVP